MRTLLLILWMLPSFCFAQDSISKRLDVSGYLTNMQSFIINDIKSDWLTDHLIHQRINLKWTHPLEHFLMDVELRNRMITGESVEDITGYDQMIEKDPGYMDLSKNISSGHSYLLNSRIDRAYISITYKKISMNAGRQRINWGQCLTWNPNDIFNAYSFFDFDYIERPGSDAIRIQYYPGSTSMLELAGKLNSQKKTTLAAMFRFNRWNYDFQLIGGILDNEDYLLGTGWSGYILNASFRGEITFLHPKTNFTDTSGFILASLGSEYAFSNSLLLQMEILYHQNQATLPDFQNYRNTNLSVKNLSFSEFSVLTRSSYTVNPLFNVSMAVLFFPQIKGFFLGPSIDYSFTENISISAIVQSFTGEFKHGTSDRFHQAFVRLKWNY